ncbi:ArpU family phage packaging/lysis transcriptional regulator [Lactiplantibacillus plantarum]|nr:ArpU family phage packaging/lysis transcriptional regulator [Lactiplantibacillus plantarum]WIR73169.1 ArpU family phage packaging/lysis transcriptional regulator [Lactiplantibacillus plantarum]
MGEQQVISDEIFPPIDQEKTIKQVRRFLDKKLPQAVRASGHSVADLKSPSMDGMPKSTPAGNSAEDRITRRLYAEQIVRQTIQAMARCDHECQEILDRLYLQGYSKTQYFDRWKPLAMLQFAQSYYLEDLNIYQNRTQTGL